MTGRNGGQIFLPAAGYRYSGKLYGTGSYGNYWSSSLSPGYDSSASYLELDSGDWGWGYGYRPYGQSVRAVCP